MAVFFFGGFDDGVDADEAWVKFFGYVFDQAAFSGGVWSFEDDDEGSADFSEVDLIEEECELVSEELFTVFCFVELEAEIEFAEDAHKLGVSCYA